MRKKVLLMFALLVTITFVIGCGTTTEEETIYSTDFYLEYVGSSGDVAEYRDKETGVHYLIYSETGYGYICYSGMCPRYNADGTLYVD